MASRTAALARATVRDRFALAASLLLLALAGLYLWLPWPVQAATPSGTLVVADLRGEALVVLDLDRGEPVRRILLPGHPHELAALPDGRVVASLEREGSLAVVDPSSARVELVQLGGTPHGLALDGEVLLVTDRSRDALRRLRIADWTELPALPVGAAPHAVAAVGKLVAIANAADDTLTLGGRAVPVSALPEAVTVHRDEVAVAGATGGAVERFDATGRRLGTVILGGRPVRLAYSTDGGTLAVSLSAVGEVALLDRQGGVRRIEVGGVPDGLAFSDDGRWLFVGDLSSGAVRAIDLEDDAVVRWDVGESAGAVLLMSAE